MLFSMKNKKGEQLSQIWMATCDSFWVPNRQDKKRDHFFYWHCTLIKMAKPDFSKKNFFFKNLQLVPQGRFFSGKGDQRKFFGKIWFGHFDRFAMPIGKMVSLFILPIQNPKSVKCGHLYLRILLKFQRVHTQFSLNYIFIVLFVKKTVAKVAFRGIGQC